MTLDELSAIWAEPTSVLAAHRLLQIRRRLRNSINGPAAHDKREVLHPFIKVFDLFPFSRHMWYIYIAFFTFSVGTAGILSFTLGRIVDITVRLSVDYTSFEEVPIFGDLSEADMADLTPVNAIKNQSVRLRIFCL